MSESKTHHKYSGPGAEPAGIAAATAASSAWSAHRFCLEFFDQFVGTGLVLTAVTIRRCAIVESKSAGGAAKAELIVIGGSEGNCSAGAMIDFAELDACNSGR